MYAKMDVKFEGYETWVYGSDDTETKSIVWVGSDRMPGKYFFYDATADKVEELATLYPWLNENDLAEMKPISYKSRDGLTIHGYLTMPKGRGEKNLPVVMMVHGGPWARDQWGYDPEAQFLANRGYAVLRTQEGTVVRDPHDVSAGERLDARVAGGSFSVSVEDAP